MERGNVHLSPGSFVPFGALWNLQREEKARKVTGDAAVTLVHTLSPTVRSLRASPPALALCPRNTDSVPIKRFLQLLVSLASKGNASPAAWSMRAASKSGGGLNPGKDKLSHVTTPGTAWQFSETKTRIICCPGDAVCASCNPPETRQCSQGQHSQGKQNGDGRSLRGEENIFQSLPCQRRSETSSLLWLKTSLPGDQVSRCLNFHDTELVIFKPFWHL